MARSTTSSGPLKKWERKISITADPGLSVTFLAAIRMRIVAEWVYKRFQTARYRRRALLGTRKAKHEYVGVEALVIGNGPSASKLDWEKVAEAQKNGLRVLAINYFPLSDASEIVSADYLVLSDPLTKPTVKTNSRTQELWKHVQATPSLKLIVPTTWFPIIQGNADLAGRTLYFDDSGLEGWIRNISPTKPRGYLALTAYKALAFAHHLGFQRINIIGIDNSMFRTVAVDYENRLIQYPNHFFEKGAVTTDISGAYPTGINDYFRDMSLCFGSLATYFIGLPIVNLDSESLVDCFPKDMHSPLLKLKGL